MPDRLQRLRLDTERHQIEGTLQLPTEGFRSRIKDFFNAHGDTFIALTDARVRPLAGGPEEHHDFLAVSARHTVLVVDLGSLGDVERPGLDPTSAFRVTGPTPGAP